MSAVAEHSSFEIRREFKRPRAAVWAAWSDAEQLQRWWGPKGCSVRALRFEFRPGGFFHYRMDFDGAAPMWGRFNFREIVPTERLVWLNSFANEHGGIARAPFSDHCPLEIENTVSFVERGGTTSVLLRATPFGELAAERNYFESLRSSLNEGYGGTFDQLTEFLAHA